MLRPQQTGIGLLAPPLVCGDLEQFTSPSAFFLMVII